MGTLGERLRREREAKGISLEEISARTRIGVRLLKAIENEVYEQLPGGVFNQSFVRQYAQYVGLDEAQAARDYLRATGAAQPMAGHLPDDVPAEGSSRARSAVFGLSLAAAVLAVIVAGVWYLVPRS